MIGLITLVYASLRQVSVVGSHVLGRVDSTRCPIPQHAWVLEAKLLVGLSSAAGSFDRPISSSISSINNINSEEGSQHRDADALQNEKLSSALPTHEATLERVEPDSPEDLTNPLNWSKKRKWTIVGILSLMSLAGNIATIMCAPASPQILRALGSYNQLFATLLVSIWELGEGLGSLIIAPLSEMYGRRLAYNGANITFVLFSALSAASVNLPMLIVMRFFSGVAVASVALNQTVVGDLFKQEERGKTMSLISMPALLGPVTGPIIGGYVAQGIGWRWVFGSSAIFSAACAIVFLLGYLETYRTVILRRQAKHASNSSDNEIQRSQLEGNPPGIKESIVRPLALLLFSPIVACLTIYISIAYGYIYIVFTTLAPVFEDQYHFPRGPVGLTYLGVALGITGGVILCSMTLDRLVKARKEAGHTMLPEHRLPILAVGSMTIVAGLFLFGWSAEARLQWMAPISGTALVRLGLVTTMISTNSYIVDAFPEHAASAMAAVGIMRSLSAAGLPLVGPPLYSKLGLGLGNTVLGCIAATGVPITLLLMRYGERIRTFSTREARNRDRWLQHVPIQQVLT